MKKVLIVIAILILAVAGGVYYIYFMPKPEKINPSLVQQTFANASEAQRSAVSNAVAAIQAGDYDKALEILDELQYDPD
ncbi:MAG: hypothetical protein J7M29_09395, partial [Verrucomicrobia bacterium]|nr:hypothetical protein [Verrucomicrobiota bacterium]